MTEAPKVTIRRATKDDADAILLVLQACAPEIPVKLDDDDFKRYIRGKILGRLFKWSNMRRGGWQSSNRIFARVAAIVRRRVVRTDLCGRFEKVPGERPIPANA